MMWRKPVIEHTEQLQSSAGTGGLGIVARNRTAPQWHPPDTLIMRDVCGAPVGQSTGSNLDRLVGRRGDSLIALACKACQGLRTAVANVVLAGDIDVRRRAADFLGRPPQTAVQHLPSSRT